jgi:UDPglucose 6-dehydrogenase
MKGREQFLKIFTATLNSHQLVRLTRAVEAYAIPGDVVAVLGLSYKPFTGVVEESQGLGLAANLIALGYKLVLSDPLALLEVASALQSAATLTEDAVTAVGLADVIVITTPWPQFAEIPPQAFVRPGRRRVVIDPWRMVSAGAIAAVADVVTLGVGGLKFIHSGREDHRSQFKTASNPG